MSSGKLSGTVLIACNCDWGCPCNFNARPTTGFCEGGWVWAFSSGSHAGVSVDGLAVSLFAKWPGAIHEGNGQAFATFDEKADSAQRSLLARIVSGELGGPWGLFSKTYSLAEPRPASYQLDFKEHFTKLKIGDSVHLEMQPMQNPVSGAETHPEIVLPEGLVVKRASLAHSRVFRVKDDFSYDYSGQYTAFGKFDYTLGAA